MSDKIQGLRNIYNRIDQAANQVPHICEALVTKVRKKDKRVELTLLPDLEEIGWVRLYMLNANGNYSSGQLPEVDTTVLVVFPRGDQNNAICLSGGYCEAGEPGYEPTGDYDLVFTDKYGNKVLMEETGITIEDKSGNKIITTSSKITIEAKQQVEVKGDTRITVDAPQIVLNGGSSPVARIGDQVTTPQGPGFITQGNATVLA
jgi:phage baseplate assembly protein gpV